METKGLVLVHTGDGKGKTTAALGLAMRAWGDGLRILILQFIKGGWKYGELKTIEELGKLSGRIEVRQCGLGFVKKGDVDEAKHKAAAKAALAEAKAAIESGKWDLIILDEINYAVTFDLVSEADVLELIDAKPANVHLVLTGRNVRPAVADKADLVTEMKLIKHPYEKGIQAQKGIEF